MSGYIIKNKSKNLSILFLSLLSLFMYNCGKGVPSNEQEPVTENEIGNEWVIYEVYPGLYEQGNAFNSISDKIDDIKKLGANVLWLMPIYEQGKLKAIGSPYSVKDYKSVNSQYGTLEDLKALVSKAHQKNMKVILDWVANHTSWDNSWIQNKDWYTQDGNGNIISPPGMNWNDVADLNFNNASMRQAMIDAMKYWINEINVDGYRCDYAEGVPDDFWKNAIEELKKIKGDDLLMLAEGGKASLLSNGFDMVYGWDFAYKLQDLYAGKITVPNLYEAHHQEYKNIPKGKQRMRYSTNHDMASELSPIQAFGGEQGAISAFVIAATLGGSPMIYSSQEIGYPTSLTFFEHTNIDWSNNLNYRSEYEKIMSAYSASEALRKGTLRTFENGRTATYLRKSQNEGVLILVNTTDQTTEAKIPIEFANEEAKNLLDDTSKKLPSAITLQPFEYKIWKI